jgi:thioredoxin-related protein
MEIDGIELQPKKMKEDPESNNNEPTNINTTKDLCELTKPDNKKNMILFGFLGIFYSNRYKKAVTLFKTIYRVSFNRTRRGDTYF